MKPRIRTVVLALLTLTGAARVSAHEVRPGYLEIRQANAETFQVSWKVPARQDMRLAIEAQFPPSCRPATDVVRSLAADAYHERFTLACPGGLDGKTVAIDGLVATMTDVLVRLERENGSAQLVRLTAAAPAFVVAAAPGRIDVASTYLELGVEHILFGIDHLLFVLALLLLVKRARRLAATVTAFTVAHSLTLAAATLGVVHVPQRPVEALIALSIVFVATEIVRGRQGLPGLTERSPWVVAFVFGLLHGFGFAGSLSEVGLPQHAIPLALLFFNVGVELGQLMFIAAVLLAVVLLGRLIVQPPSWSWRLAAYGIGGLAAYWTIERVAAFWS